MLKLVTGRSVVVTEHAGADAFMLGEEVALDRSIRTSRCPGWSVYWHSSTMA
jgi:hypothetical protein